MGVLSVKVPLTFLVLSASGKSAFLSGTHTRLRRAPAMASPAFEPDAGFSTHVLDVVFMGTGQSSGLPLIKHVLHGGCATCQDAMRPGSKNRRNNVSVALIKRKRGDPAGAVCSLIDCGKTFRDGILNQFPVHGLKEIAALVLTHGHADAILGMDDLRDLQQYVHVDPGVRYESGPIDVYLHSETMSCLRNRFDYLTAKPVYLDEAKGILERPVSYLRFHEMDVNSEFDAGGIPVRSFPVLHGGDYISLGFNVGMKGSFVYISDVKIIPEATMAYLKTLRIGVLVLDCLKLTPGNFAHASLDEALAWHDELSPERYGVWDGTTRCG